MLTTIYIYFNFTIINIFIVQIAYFAKTRHVVEMDWAMLECIGMGY